MKLPPRRRKKPERAAFYTSEEFVSLSGALAANLRRLRYERNLSQEEAAALCDLPLRTYQYCETGRGNVALVTLTRLAKGFNLSAMTLLDESYYRELLQEDKK